MSDPRRRRVGVILFPRFELLDVFGPLEMFGLLPDWFDLTLVTEHGGSVPSAQGPASVVDATFEQAPPLDVLLVPGGIGTRREVENPAMLTFLRDRAARAEVVTSVCTGAGVLAAAGLLRGRRATSNKRAFAWVQTQGDGITWVPEARWVEDGNVFTAGGVAAGIDMSLAVIERLLGPELAKETADRAEYDWHTDASWDPFAAKAGLVPPRGEDVRT
jgi:transcriptional regulator GlxA family with amidase domain